MKLWDPPIYLHFLDRELAESVGLTLTPVLAESAVKCLLLATTSHLFAGLSLGWESPAMKGRFLQLALLLRDAGLLSYVSNYATLDEFLSSRQHLYRHDAGRYPRYFSPRARNARELIVPTEFKATSATVELTRGLAEWATTSDYSIQLAPEGALEMAIRQRVLRALSRRESEAITYPFFARDLTDVGPVAEAVLRRRISNAYTRHYKSFGGAVIVTGIQGLEHFESEGSGFPLFDVSLLTLVLKALGFAVVLEKPWVHERHFWFRAIGERGSIIHEALRENINLLLAASEKTALHLHVHSPGSTFGVRRNIAAMVRRATAVVSTKWSQPIPSFDQCIERLYSLIAALGRNVEFNRHLEETRMAQDSRNCDLLLVVATNVEREAILERCHNLNGSTYSRRFGERRTYFDLGYVGGARLFLVQCEQGSVSPGASLPTISDAIDDLHPGSVLLAGIAFGVDADKQDIGEILVSRQLQPYELQRLGTDDQGSIQITPRGDTVTASTKLLGRFRAATAGWGDGRVEFGLILSGEKLVDNIDFRDQLRAVCKGEALGGEMEGAGLYAAASERHTDWIVVKAICDWADGKKKVKKKERQQRAAAQAAHFILHAIALGGFGRGSGRYGKT